VEPLYGNDVSVALSVALSAALSSCTDLLNTLRFWNTVFSNRRKGSYLGLSLFLYRNATVPLGPWATYEVRIPSCDVLLERSCQELSNDIQLMDPLTVI
jgi:hypothetical protein